MEMKLYLVSELIDSHSVTTKPFIRPLVMSLNFSQIFKENQSAIGLFMYRIINFTIIYLSKRTESELELSSTLNLL